MFLYVILALLGAGISAINATKCSHFDLVVCAFLVDGDKVSKSGLAESGEILDRRCEETLPVLKCLNDYAVKCPESDFKHLAVFFQDEYKVQSKICDKNSELRKRSHKTKEKEIRIRNSLKENRSLLDVGFQKLKSDESNEGFCSTVEQPSLENTEITTNRALLIKGYLAHSKCLNAFREKTQEKCGKLLEFEDAERFTKDQCKSYENNFQCSFTAILGDCGKEALSLLTEVLMPVHNFMEETCKDFQDLQYLAPLKFLFSGI